MSKKDKKHKPSDWDEFVSATLDDALAAELKAARETAGAKRRLSEAELRQKRRAALAKAAAMSPAERREIGRRLAEGRAAATQRRREAREAAGLPEPVRAPNHRDPSQRTLEPYIERVYDENPDAELTPLEARRMAVTLYRLARLEAIED
jgi:hypothetical protein